VKNWWRLPLGWSTIRANQSGAARKWREVRLGEFGSGLAIIGYIDFSGTVRGLDKENIWPKPLLLFPV
jgi:hypothetical protein